MICDFWGLVRVCGAPIAMRWIFAIVANFAAILDRKDLQPADRALGGTVLGQTHAVWCYFQDTWRGRDERYT